MLGNNKNIYNNTIFDSYDQQRNFSDSNSSCDVTHHENWSESVAIILLVRMRREIYTILMNTASFDTKFYLIVNYTCQSSVSWTIKDLSKRD